MKFVYLYILDKKIVNLKCENYEACEVNSDS